MEIDCLRNGDLDCGIFVFSDISKADHRVVRAGKRGIFPVRGAVFQDIYVFHICQSVPANCGKYVYVDRQGCRRCVYVADQADPVFDAAACGTAEVLWAGRRDVRGADCGLCGVSACGDNAVAGDASAEEGI